MLIMIIKLKTVLISLVAKLCKSLNSTLAKKVRKNNINEMHNIYIFFISK
jgi:hypothetical protein